MGKTLGVGAFAKGKSMNKIKNRSQAHNHRKRSSCKNNIKIKNKIKFCKRKSIKRNKNDEKFKSS